MNEIALARHGESVSAAQGLVGGDTPPTLRGRDEARVLGQRLRPRAIDVCVTSGARRAQQTAAIALEGTSILATIDNDLGDIRFDCFEGKPLTEYRRWIALHRPEEAPLGGESRIETIRRFARAFRALLARPEDLVLVVAHGLTLRSVLDPKPGPIVAGTAYGSCVLLTAAELERAVNLLEGWCDAPSW